MTEYILIRVSRKGGVREFSSDSMCKIKRCYKSFIGNIVWRAFRQDKDMCSVLGGLRGVVWTLVEKTEEEVKKTPWDVNNVREKWEKCEFNKLEKEEDYGPLIISGRYVIGED